jgi:hypothetical protein
VTSAVISPKLGSIGLGYVRYEYLAEGTRCGWRRIDAIVGSMAEDLDFQQAQLAYSIMSA